MTEENNIAHEDNYHQSRWNLEKLTASAQLAMDIQNPVLMWHSIYTYMHLNCFLDFNSDGEEAVSEDFVLPPIMADFVLQTAISIVKLAQGRHPINDRYRQESTPLSPKEAIDLLPQALGFTRQGYNAFADFDSIYQKVWEAKDYDEARQKGMSSKDALEALCKTYGDMDHSQRRKRIRLGRSFLRNGIYGPYPAP